MKYNFVFTLVACSALMLLAGNGGEIVYTKPLKAVIFSHKAHTEDIGLHCTWCHEKTFEMKALKMQEQPDNNMESLCNEKYCGVCHNSDIAFSTTTQCARCHIGKMAYNEYVRQGKIKADKMVPNPKEEAAGRRPRIDANEDLTQAPPMTTVSLKSGKSTVLKQMIKNGYYPGAISLKPTEGMPPVVFSHRTHTERQQQRCTECHPKIFKMKVVENFGEKAAPAHANMVEKGKYCGVCHNAEKAFSVLDAASCDKCHRTVPALRAAR